MIETNTRQQTPRVMHVIPSLNGYGAEHFVASLLPLLAAHGTAVAALTVYANGKTDSLDGVPVFRAERRRRADVSFFPRMVAAMQRFRPDVVHTHMHNGKYWGRLAALAAGVRHIVHTEHDPNFNAARFERAAASVLVRRTSRFVAFSTGHRQRLALAEGIPLEKIVVIPNGIAFRQELPNARDYGRRLLGADASERAIIMVGRLEHQKNHALALRAFARLLERSAQTCRLYIIGAGALEPLARSFVEEHDIAHKVVFMGFRTDALDLLAGADVLLMSSLREAMPIVLLESMSLSIPVVSTPWAGADEMLNAGALGYVAPGFEPEELAETLERALADPVQAAAKAAAAREKAHAEYDIRTAAHRHAELYRSLVSAR